jgi:hypothetical protein
MAGKFADGVYSHKPWNAAPQAAYPPQSYLGPFQSNQERLCSQSLAVYQMTGIELQQHVRPPFPQVANLFPQKYGYIRDAYGIEDIIKMKGRPEQRVESDFSQTPNSTQSTSRNTLGTTI